MTPGWMMAWDSMMVPEWRVVEWQIWAEGWMWMWECRVVGLVRVEGEEGSWGVGGLEVVVEGSGEEMLVVTVVLWGAVDDDEPEE